ncbi:MAG: hypothetical protein ACXWHZ_06775 [Usitatibacter sp.]
MNAYGRRRFSHATFTAGLALASTAALAQDARPEPPEYRDRAEAREAYRRGYETGFERGYRKGLEDGERRAAPIVAPPPAAAPPRLGPIRVSGAFYGTSSKNCDATRYVASRANGKRSYSFEVTNNICGDPARGDRKELSVTYRCGEVDKTSSANEHRTIYLDCTF